MKRTLSFVAVLLIACAAIAGPFASNSGGGGSGGSGTVTSVGVTGANGVSSSGGPVTTSGNITVGLGAITPSSLNTGSITATTATLSTLTGLLKANGSSPITAATSGTDYAPATSGTNILVGNGSGGFSPVQGSSASANGSLGLGGVTVTASDPVLNVSQTWNNSGVAFTGALFNYTVTASNNSGFLARWQRGSTDQVTIDEFGQLKSNGLVTGSTTQSWWTTNSNGAALPSNLGLAFTSGSNNALTTKDAGIARVAAGVIECNKGAVGTYAGSACGAGSQTVAQLPTCNSTAKGARSFVTDATATTFLSTVVGSGANNVPVVCDGTNWKIGAATLPAANDPIFAPAAFA